MRRFVATVVALALSAGALTITALSASAGPEEHLEFVLRLAGENRMDNDGDSALSVGDTYVARNDVLDSKGEQSVGRLAIDCVIIAFPTESDPTELSRCHGALIQNDGKLMLSTVTTQGELNNQRIGLAVIGGTGRYRGATGEAVNDLTAGKSRLFVDLD